MVTKIQQYVVMSTDRSEWPDTKLAGAELNMNPYSTMNYNSSSHSPSLVVGLSDKLCWNSTPVHSSELRPDGCLQRSPTSSSNVQCSNLMDLKDQPFCHQNEQQLCFVKRQESEQQQEEVESHLGASPPSILGCSPAAHLPEPPEADLEVSQAALPERGKLLQAVMQAGPLLQTLLLTGPLPQWRYPPPVLDSVEIPRISMCSSSNSHVSVSPRLVHYYVPTPHGPAGPLQVNSGVTASSTHHSLSPRTRMNKPHIAASQQSGSAAASSSSKLLFAPVLNSLDSDNTRGATLKLAKMQ